jgi:hypothetical protein
MPEAFFIPDGDLFVPTELTRGPWSWDERGMIGRGTQALLVASRR